MELQMLSILLWEIPVLLFNGVFGLISLISTIEMYHKLTSDNPPSSSEIFNSLAKYVGTFTYIMMVILGCHFAYQTMTLQATSQMIHFAGPSLMLVGMAAFFLDFCKPKNA
jgi:hypothetical protein